jgi:hypothetical protein
MRCTDGWTDTDRSAGGNHWYLTIDADEFGVPRSLISE